MSYSPWADNFLPLMSQVITLTPYTTGGNSQRILGTPHSYHGYISADEKAVFTPTGQTVFSTSLTLIHPLALDGTVLTTATPDMVLTLPGGVTPRILSIGSLVDEVGIVAFQIRS